MERYTVVRSLGRGSFGTVYLARLKVDSSMLFVIKRVRCETAAEAEVARSEVALLSSLAHPQVLGYIDSFTHKAHLCIVTEFCSGGDLNVRLRSLNPDQHLGEETVLDWLLQITQALAHLHSQGVLHRDLKTQNIFLTCAEGGRLRLGDFGIARTLRAGGEEMAETYVGTPFFMSPELMASQPYGHATDMWSLGCVLQELCTNQHAFTADNMESLALKILRSSPPPIPPQFSHLLRSTVSALLSKNAVDRPSAAALLASPLLAPRAAARAAADAADAQAHIQWLQRARQLASLPPYATVPHRGMGQPAAERGRRISGPAPTPSSAACFVDPNSAASRVAAARKAYAKPAMVRRGSRGGGNSPPASLRLPPPSSAVAATVRITDEFGAEPPARRRRSSCSACDDRLSCVPPSDRGPPLRWGVAASSRPRFSAGAPCPSSALGSAPRPRRFTDSTAHLPMPSAEGAMRRADALLSLACAEVRASPAGAEESFTTREPSPSPPLSLSASTEQQPPISSVGRAVGLSASADAPAHRLPLLLPGLDSPLAAAAPAAESGRAARVQALLCALEAQLGPELALRLVQWTRNGGGAGGVEGVAREVEARVGAAAVVAHALAEKLCREETV